MKQLTNNEIEKTTNFLYENSGMSSVFDWVGKYNSHRFNKIPYEKCEACDTSVPSLEHNCLICGQETKPKEPVFYQAVLKKVKGNIFNHVYPHIENADKQFTLGERLGNENGCCTECGGNEWMLLPKESVAVKQGGKPYIECLECGATTHL
jgi:hypothetical protein